MKYSRIQWKPGNMIFPLPAVLVSCGTDPENFNIITIAWTGTTSTNPPTCYISIRKERHSYKLIKDSGEFVINLTTEKLTRATDWCGVKSGRNFNKFREMKLTPIKGEIVKAPLIAESPVNIECKVRQIIPLGSHDMFLADVVCINADPDYMDHDSGAFMLEKAGLISYSHGNYYSSGKKIGKFGYSVQKKKKKE